MQLSRRRLFQGTSALVGLAFLEACAQETVGNLQDGITEAGRVTDALWTAYLDLQVDAPKLIPKGSPNDLQAVAAYQAARAAVAAMNVSQPKLAIGTGFRAVESDFNTIANLANVAIGAAGTIDPAAQPFVIAFQAGNLIFQNVIEPLIAQLIPGTASAVRMPPRFNPPAGLTVAGAKTILEPLAGRARAVRAAGH